MLAENHLMIMDGQWGNLREISVYLKVGGKLGKR